jgi:hypothetical protein
MFSTFMCGASYGSRPHLDGPGRRHDPDKDLVVEQEILDHGGLSTPDSFLKISKRKGRGSGKTKQGCVFRRVVWHTGAS